MQLADFDSVARKHSFYRLKQLLCVLRVWLCVCVTYEMYVSTIDAVRFESADWFTALVYTGDCLEVNSRSPA